MDGNSIFTKRKGGTVLTCGNPLGRKEEQPYPRQWLDQQNLESKGWQTHLRRKLLVLGRVCGTEEVLLEGVQDSANVTLQ